MEHSVSRTPEQATSSGSSSAQKKPSTVHPAYAKGLEAAARKISYPGTIEAKEALVVESRGVKLSLLVNEKGIVTNARHTGAKGNEEALVDLLCKEMVGRSLQEGAEHAAIRLEFSLREPGVELPVKGLLTPDNADPIFQIAKELPRAAFRKYLDLTKGQPQWNDWEDALSAKWAGLSEQDRIALAQKEIDQAAKDLNLLFTHFQVLAVKWDIRLTIAMDANANHPKYGQYLMQLERELKHRVEKRIELVLEGLEDKNNRESRTKRENTFK